MNPMRQALSFLFVLSGVVFEYFDIMLVSLLASTLVLNFVGTSTDEQRLIYGFLAYGIAFVVRPLGAVLFGVMGDLTGRRTALIASMGLMSLATLAIGVIPNYTQAGIMATVLFLFCRIAQGVAVGGEYGTAVTYAFELHPKYRTFFGGCVVGATHVGGLSAALLASYYAEHVRYAFVIAGTLGLALLLLRFVLLDPDVVQPRNVKALVHDTLKGTRQLVRVIVLTSALAFVFYGGLIYLNELALREFGVSRSTIFGTNALLLSLWVIVPPVVGFLCDRQQLVYKRVMLVGSLGVLCVSPLLGETLVFGSFGVFVGAQVVLHLFHMLFCLGTPRYFGELFGSGHRNTSIAIGYAVGASFVPALAPWVLHGCVNFFGSPKAIMLPFMVVGGMTALLLFSELRDEGHERKMHARRFV